jgi:prevent-host-death family protein
MTIDFKALIVDNCIMIRVSIHELQQDLSAFLQRVQAGEAILITQAGKPVAEITPIAQASDAPRPFGLAVGEFVVPDDFDQPLPENVLQEFEG